LAIRAIFDEIPKETLNHVDVSWIKRLKWVIKNEEKYFHKLLKNKDFSFKIYTEKGQCMEFLIPLYLSKSFSTAQPWITFAIRQCTFSYLLFSHHMFIQNEWSELNVRD
jgi:hypothetical protein